MSAVLYGEVINVADNAGDFGGSNVSADDDFAQGTGAPGAKASNTYMEFTTQALGASAPYNFSSAGNEFGMGFIMWFSSKSKLDPLAGYTLVVGSGTNLGQWNVPPVVSELKRNGAFVSRIITLDKDFDLITGGTGWTLTGNPAQLNNIDLMGGGLTTSVSIMGSFNNVQIDQLTLGFGIRLSGAPSGSPDSFETARIADEDVGVWGFSQEEILKGGIYIGPETGSATSYFTSIGETRKFAAEKVSPGFYKIHFQGSATVVDIQGANISAKNSAVARWDYSLAPEVAAQFSDQNSVYSGIRNMTLQTGATIKNLKISDISSVIQNGCAIDGCNFSEADTLSGTALITSDAIDAITNCVFNHSAGHAIEITTPGSYSMSNNQFVGYGGDGSNEAAIYNNSGGQVDLYIDAQSSGVTVRDAPGSTTTVFVSQTAVTFTGIPPGLEFRIRLGAKTLAYHASVTDGSVTYSYPASGGNSPVGRKVTITTGGESTDGNYYTPYEVLYELPPTNTTTQLILEINPSYIA